MKYIQHKKMFTFVYNGKQYRASTGDEGFSYAKIFIYKHLNKPWYSFFSDPIDIKISTIPLTRQRFYESKEILLIIKDKLDIIVEKRLIQQLESAQQQHAFTEDINTLR